MKQRAPLTFWQRVNWAAIALAAAAALFVAYPALRGYGSEAGLAGAELYARPAWLYSHVSAMFGFALLATGIGVISRRAGAAAWIGTLLVLPYYGAEAFGLHALGREAVELGDGAAIAAADSFRFEPVAMTTFAIGWIGLAVAGWWLIRDRQQLRRFGQIGAVLTGVALLLFLPQFFFPPAGRISHGVLLAVGLALIAIDLWQQQKKQQ